MAEMPAIIVPMTQADGALLQLRCDEWESGMGDCVGASPPQSPIWFIPPPPGKSIGNSYMFLKYYSLSLPLAVVV